MKEFTILQCKLLRFANDHVEKLKQIRPEALSIKSDRMLDNLELLLAIATLAGSDWLDKAKKAFLSIDGEIVDETSIGTSLLKDIKEIFSTKCMSKIFSKDLLGFLLLDEEKPWVTYNMGKPITQKQMATILIGFNIRSKALRIEYENLKGYDMAQFEEAFERYLPSDANSAVVKQPITCPKVELSKTSSSSSNDIATVQESINTIE